MIIFQDKEKALFAPQSPFYEAQATACADKQVAVDLFLAPNSLRVVLLYVVCLFACCCLCVAVVVVDLLPFCFLVCHILLSKCSQFFIL